MTLLRADRAPRPRTLVDIFRESVATTPDAPALDNGAQTLTYSEFELAAEEVAEGLATAGIGPGDRVGVRIRSGTTDLYVAIMGTLLAGACYVPVDADDPQERADLVFGEAEVAAVVGDGLELDLRRPGAPREVADPSLTDDAWVIFTSGSTGKPKGVAVSHRSAAGFVDAESRMFLQGAPIGPGDRVMAGLSVAFDASCEEMWLAWGHGACLVPAPRSLVRSGMDLGPWLTANDITVVSTVPTLVSLWPTDALADVRLLILGGEACPPEIGARLARPHREVWNTYGPTEATVVACGAQLGTEPPVRIGLPLDGWDLAVVDAHGQPVPEGGSGELIIGGIGLARYLDPDKDAEKYAPMPSLGWDRAYRTGDLVQADPEGLLFLGRADDQVKVGGRRIELGEIDSALLGLPFVSGAAAAVRRTATGNSVIVGYLAVEEGFDRAASIERLRGSMPDAMVPRLAVVDTLPTRTSGKIDRDALPWPLEDDGGESLDGTAGFVQALWKDVLGTTAAPDDDFFDLGGRSVTAAQLVARLRDRFPEVTVGDVYASPTVTGLAEVLDGMAAPAVKSDRKVRPVPRKTQLGQALFTVPLRTLTALRWTAWIGLGCWVGDHGLGLDFLPTPPLWLVLVLWLALISPPGRMLLTAAGARLLLRPVPAGTYPRGGRAHLRLWMAERLADELGAANLSGAVLMRLYARLLGAHIGRHVDLHSVPPVTGMLHLGDGCSVEPEVDLSGHWLDGDTLHVGPVRVGRDARVGARSMLLPGARVGRGAEIAPGSAVFGEVPASEAWSGAPAVRTGSARGPWSPEPPPNKREWLAAYAAVAVVISILPLIGVVAAVAAGAPYLSGADGLAALAGRALLWLLPGTLVGFAVVALLVLGLGRLLGAGLHPGAHAVLGLRGWQAWSTIRLLDEARTWLFPLYSSALTPLWLKALGARIGDDVEASTVLLIPGLTWVNDGAFLADDTLLGGYELGGGWLRVDHVKVGKRAFVGNSGMAAPGRKVPRGSLVAVLSAAPSRLDARKGASWIGSPPAELRRTSEDADTSRTYDPPRRLRVARSLVEACRVVPLWVGTALYVAVAWVLLALADAVGWWLAALLGGLVLMVAGAVAAGLTTLAKWVLVGRFTVGDHPLWSAFVWRNELADTFVEVVAAPWFARAATGSTALNVWLRSMGAQIGRGVWCETYWLPESDLVRLGDGATVNQGCVVQTHLFHDRMLSMDRVTLRAGSTLGPNSVILPAATLGRHSTVGPVSLVMRGESVPDRTRWIGNPIGPWAADDTSDR